jgi:hypothetical protein
MHARWNDIDMYIYIYIYIYIYMLMYIIVNPNHLTPNMKSFLMYIAYKVCACVYVCVCVFA